MKIANPIVEQLKKRVVLVHGFFNDNFFDHLKKENVEVFVLEGRPDLVSGQHACRKLLQREMTPTVIADNMAGFLFKHDCVKAVWISGHEKEHDTFKALTGSLILAVLAKTHNVPFHVFEGEHPLSQKHDAGALLKFCGIQVAEKETKTLVPEYDLICLDYVTKSQSHKDTRSQ
ncbi:MAG: hypothetical protein HQL26_06390 [Candidatus Omnitrophica bacterium]|nr:hypothetical protein [Candidatus Omnitrophota bacterium]